MPGHKRNIKFCIPSSNIDITEISGFDNLHSPTGIIKNLQESLATLYGYKKHYKRKRFNLLHFSGNKRSCKRKQHNNNCTQLPQIGIQCLFYQQA